MAAATRARGDDRRPSLFDREERLEFLASVEAGKNKPPPSATGFNQSEYEQRAAFERSATSCVGSFIRSCRAETWKYAPRPSSGAHETQPCGARSAMSSPPISFDAAGPTPQSPAPCLSRRSSE